MVFYRNPAKDFTDAVVYDQIRDAVVRGSIPVYENQMSATECTYKSCCGVNRERCTSNNQHISLLQSRKSLCYNLLIQTLAVQHHVRLYDAAAFFTPCNAIVVFVRHDIGTVVKSTAGNTVVPHHASVKFQHISASCRLMQTVDILRNHSLQFSNGLKLRKFFVSRVRFNSGNKNLFPVKAVELAWIISEKSCA
jgi:hypothetical protein